MRRCSSTVSVEIDVSSNEQIEELKQFFKVSLPKWGGENSVVVRGRADRIYGYLLLHCYEDVVPDVYPELFDDTGFVKGLR